MAIYYIDATGGLDSNNGTSDSTPWQTLTKIETSSGDGDTIFFKRGETWTTKGSANATAMLQIPASNIILDAYGSGNKPIINGGGTIRNGIMIPGGIVNTTTKNLKIYNCGGGTGALWANSGSGLNTIEDCDLDTHLTDACATSSVGSSSIVRRCDLSNFADDGFTCHGLNGTGSSVEMYNCTIHDGFDGLNHSVTNGGNITTLCESCTFYSNSSHDIGSLDVGTHTFNRCRFGVTGETISSSVCQHQTNASPIIFNYCIIDATAALSNAAPGISVSAGGTLEFNNCVFCGNSSVSGGTGTINVFSPSTIAFTNCIFSNWWRRCYRDLGNETATANFCIAHQINTGTLSSNTNQVSTADPLFVNVSSGDFRVQSTSPAINAGTNLGISTDFAGNLVRNPPEVGAFEFIIATSIKLGQSILGIFHPKYKYSNLSNNKLHGI